MSRPPDLYTGTDVGFSSICVGKDSTAQFLKDVLGELAALTPGPYIHIGGDEANATAIPDYLQFIQQVQSILAANGKQMIGWDPIAQVSLRPGTLVQETEFDAALARRAVQQGNKLILSPANRAYLDMKYTPDHEPRPELGRNHRGAESLCLGPGRVVPRHHGSEHPGGGGPALVGDAGHAGRRGVHDLPAPVGTSRDWLVAPGRPGLVRVPAAPGLPRAAPHGYGRAFLRLPRNPLALGFSPSPLRE